MQQKSSIFKRKSKFLLLSILFFIVLSCEKFPEGIGTAKNEPNGEIIVENGYLNFPSQQSLDNYISQIDNELSRLSSEDNLLKASSIISVPSGYQLMAGC